MTIYTYNPGPDRTLECLYDTGAETLSIGLHSGRWYVTGVVAGGANVWMFDGSFGFLQALRRRATSNDLRGEAQGNGGHLYFGDNGSNNSFFSTTSVLDLATPANSLTDRWNKKYASEGCAILLNDAANGRVLIGMGAGGGHSLRSVSYADGSDVWAVTPQGTPGVAGVVIHGLAISGSTLYCAGDRGGSRSIWSRQLSDGSAINDLDSGARARGVAVASDGTVLVCGDQSSTLTGTLRSVWHLSADLSTVLGSYDTGGRAHDVKVSPDGQTLIVCHDRVGVVNITELNIADLSVVNQGDTGAAHVRRGVCGAAGDFHLVGARDPIEPCSVWKWARTSNVSDMNIHDGAGGRIEFCTTCCDGSTP